jgi:hypothetical protein
MLDPSSQGGTNGLLDWPRQNGACPAMFPELEASENVCGWW